MRLVLLKLRNINFPWFMKPVSGGGDEYKQNFEVRLSNEDVLSQSSRNAFAILFEVLEAVFLKECGFNNFIAGLL